MRHLRVRTYQNLDLYSIFALSKMLKGQISEKFRLLSLGLTYPDFPMNKILVKKSEFNQFTEIILSVSISRNLLFIQIFKVFINELKSKQHLVTVRNNRLDIYRDGIVHWVSRMTVVAACRMNFRFYPLDTQFCYLSLESCKNNLNFDTLYSRTFFYLSIF